MLPAIVHEELTYEQIGLVLSRRPVAFSKLDTSRSELEQRMWLRRLLRWLIRDEKRRERRASRTVFAAWSSGALPDCDVGEDTTRNVDEADLEEKFWAAVFDIVSKKYRDALSLRFREDMLLNEVGAELGISTSAAYNHVQRGLDELRMYLTLYPDDSVSSLISEYLDRGRQV